MRIQVPLRFGFYAVNSSGRSGDLPLKTDGNEYSRRPDFNNDTPISLLERLRFRSDPHSWQRLSISITSIHRWLARYRVQNPSDFASDSGSNATLVGELPNFKHDHRRGAFRAVVTYHRGQPPESTLAFRARSGDNDQLLAETRRPRKSSQSTLGCRARSVRCSPLVLE